MKLKILYLLMSILVLLNSCNYRKQSKERFEKITKIELSNSINVIIDRFESAGPDYSLFYKFGLNENDCLDFKSKLKESKEWINKDGVWTFYKTVNGIIYKINFSEKECKVSYNEDLI